MMHALMTAQSMTKKAKVSPWCRVLGVSRSDWYRSPSQYEQQCLVAH